jgi:hypothetical protein
MSSADALAGLSAPAAEAPVEKPAARPLRSSAVEKEAEEKETEEVAPVDAFRSDPLPDRTSTPSLERAGVEPLAPAKREHADTLDVKLDLTGQEGEIERKDGKIRRLGWGEYGRKLFERNSKRDGRKKKK